MVSTTSLASVGTEMSVRKNTSRVNVNILMAARPPKAVKKDTPKGAENMTLDIVGLKVIVLTNI